jgi:hypothetical protein
MVLNPETDETFPDLLAVSGSDIVPGIPIPVDTKQNSLTLSVMRSDESRKQNVQDPAQQVAWPMCRRGRKQQQKCKHIRLDCRDL